MVDYMTAELLENIIDCNRPRFIFWKFSIKFSCLMVVLAHMIGVLSNCYFHIVLCESYALLTPFTFVHVPVHVPCTGIIIMCVHVHVPIVQVLQIMYKAMHSGLVSL